MVEGEELGAIARRVIDANRFMTVGSADEGGVSPVCYRLPEPRPALAEAFRVMRPGGLIAAAAPSRRDSPELVRALPRRPLTFDAELAPGLLRGLFGEPGFVAGLTLFDGPSFLDVAAAMVSVWGRAPAPAVRRGGP